jgi:hypothetical protein
VDGVPGDLAGLYRIVGAGMGTGMSSTGKPCIRCTSRNCSPNASAVAGRSSVLRDIACSITAHTSVGRPESRRFGIGCLVILRNWATICSPLRRSNTAWPVPAQNSVDARL